MFPIIPKWTGHNVKDWQELLVKNDDGHTEINDATATIINYMPIIGTPVLTQENLEDTWRRIAIHQAIFGSYINDADTGKPLFLTKTDVERHIGLETEGHRLSFQEFCAEIEKTEINTELTEIPSFIANGNATMLEVCGV